MTENLKCVIVGDGSVGKTSMILTYVNGEFPKDYVPAVFDNCNKTVLHGGKNISLGLWDTAGGEENAKHREYGTNRLRLLSYPETAVFLITFSVVDPASFQNVRTKWHPELLEHSPGTPIILVGTKTDLREDSSMMRQLQEQDAKPKTRAEGEKLAKELRMDGYYEVSSLKETPKSPFEAAVDTVLNSGSCGAPNPSGTIRGFTFYSLLLFLPILNIFVALMMYFSLRWYVQKGELMYTSETTRNRCWKRIRIGLVLSLIPIAPINWIGIALCFFSVQKIFLD